jgi:hypothetical protein
VNLRTLGASDGSTSLPPRACTIGNPAHEPGKLGVAWDLLAEEVRGELRVGEVEKPLEYTMFSGARLDLEGVRIALEQDIELLHAPPATPKEAPPLATAGIGKPHERRSRSIFLISAMALAGFRSLGHTSVQFMIVWQR